MYCANNLLHIQVEYTKDAEKSKHDYNLPHDAPQFVKAKEVADNASDVSIVYCGFVKR